MFEHVPQLNALSDLTCGIFNALCYDFRLVSVSLQQAWVQFGYRRRAYEYKVGLRKDSMDLFRSLDINIKKSNQLLLFEFINLCFLWAIEIGMDLAVLNKFVSFYLWLESCMIYEMIVDSIDFTFTSWASRIGDTESESVTILFEYFVHKSTFTCTWRSHYC